MLYVDLEGNRISRDGEKPDWSVWKCIYVTEDDEHDVVQHCERIPESALARMKEIRERQIFDQALPDRFSNLEATAQDLVLALADIFGGTE